MVLGALGTAVGRAVGVNVGGRDLVPNGPIGADDAREGEAVGI